jgi:hypothetical protein
MDAYRLDDERPEVKDRPSTIPIQPYPRDTLVVVVNGSTVVSRLWEPGDTELCRYCVDCKATENHLCSVGVPFVVPVHLAPTLSTRSLRRPGPPLRLAEGDG